MLNSIVYIIIINLNRKEIKYGKKLNYRVKKTIKRIREKNRNIRPYNARQCRNYWN